MEHNSITHCRVCNSKIHSFMSFGKMPIANGFLTLGQWQRIFVVELDESKITPREIVVQVMGI